MLILVHQELIKLSLAIISIPVLQVTTGYRYNISNHTKPLLKIIGGYKASKGEFPYQVSLRSFSSYISTLGHFCGGSIVDSTHVITAAHCLYNQNASDLYIVAGTTHLTDTGVQIRVQSFSYHNLYDGDMFNYDVGIVKLMTDLDINNETIKALGLQISLPSAGTRCTVSGWGTTSVESSSIPSDLMAVDVEISDWNSCVKNYSKYGGGAPEIGMFCAGHPEGGKDACTGDSGGPLVCEGLLTGIVSWGAGCGEPNLPGIYSDVAYFRDWLQDEEYITNTGESLAVHNASNSVNQFYCLLSFVLLSLILAFSSYLSKDVTTPLKQW